MISRNLWNRLKRLEDKIKPRREPEATPKQLQLIQRLMRQDGEWRWKMAKRMWSLNQEPKSSTRQASIQ